jgi:hypothetical protein
MQLNVKTAVRVHSGMRSQSKTVNGAARPSPLIFHSKNLKGVLALRLQLLEKKGSLEKKWPILREAALPADLYQAVTGGRLHHLRKRLRSGSGKKK